MSDYAKKLLLVILAGSAFGSSVVFARLALVEVGPFPVTVMRFGIAAAAYAVTLPWLNKRFYTDAKRLKHTSIVGVVGTGLPLLLFYFALAYISSGTFSVLFAMMPLFTALLAHFFLTGERLNVRLVAGLLLSLLGVVLLIATRSNGLIESDFDIRGPMIVLAGVLMAAAGAVYARRFLSNEDPLSVSATQTVAAFIFITLFVLASGNWELGSVSAVGWFAIFYNGIVGSYVAFWLVFTLVRQFGATASSLPGYVMPVVSAALGAVMLGEVITPFLVLGAGLILGGVLFASGRPD